VTAEQRKRMEFQTDNRWWVDEVAEVSRVCLDERDAAMALARRVHAECGPKEYPVGGSNTSTYWICDSCYGEADLAKDIKHPPDCLWLAHDALLKGVGQ
jgi:hypothetical protein